MQPGVTVALVTVWLAVVVGAASLPSHHYVDQYSPLPPNHPEKPPKPRVHTSWKDEIPREDPFVAEDIDPSIHATERKSSHPFVDDGSLDGSLRTDFGARRHEVEGEAPTLPQRGRNHREHSNAAERKVEQQRRNSKFLEPEDSDEEEDDGAILYPKDAFVADDIFQDQGPGSVEVYKLDLFKDRSLLPPAPTKKTIPKHKSKSPKKAPADRIIWKSKTAEPKVYQPARQPQVPIFFDEFPLGSSKDEVFGAGGVPELQVGCEGLEASYRQKRSAADSTDANKFPSDVTPLDIEPDYEDDPYTQFGETDELKILRILETKTEKPTSHALRGDMDPIAMNEYFSRSRPEKLPTRGDLGPLDNGNLAVSVVEVASTSNNDAPSRGEAGSSAEERSYSGPVDGARKLSSSSDDPSGSRSGRKLMSIADEGSSDDALREKRETLWGFGENEGAITSDELRTELRRRQRDDDDERWRVRQEENEARRRFREQEEERRRNDQATSSTPSLHAAQDPDIQRIRDEYERQLEEQTLRNRTRSRRPDDEMVRREKHRKRLEAEARREKQRREQKSRARKKNRGHLEEETQRNQSMSARPDQRDYERRKALWQKQMEERRRYEDERNRQAPANLVRSGSPRADKDERRQQEEERRVREQDEKLRDYIQRNRPIAPVNRGRAEGEEERRRMRERPSNLTGAHSPEAPRTRLEQEEQRRRAEEYRRRMEEERKLQDFIRRNQPVKLERRPSDETAREAENYLEARRRMEAARRFEQNKPITTIATPPVDGRRSHGPAAPPPGAAPRIVSESDGRRLDALRRQEEKRRVERQRYEEEERRREALRREEERRRLESHRYEEERKRQEAARIAAEKANRELIEEEARRANVGRARSPGGSERRGRVQQIGPPTYSLAPENLVKLDDGRNAREREARERELQYERRLKEQKQREEATTSLKEQRRLEEEARLNALPVSARIILDKSIRNVHSSRSPMINSRGNFENEIDFPGINPNRQGFEAARFPVPATTRPPVKSPGPCTWAIIQCCPANRRTVACFESLGCPGAGWDPDPCRYSIVEAARNELTKFYEANERN